MFRVRDNQKSMRASSPCALVYEVPDCLVLVSDDVDDGTDLFAKVFEQVSVLLPLDDAASAGDDVTLRVLFDQTLEDLCLSLAEVGPAVGGDKGRDGTIQGLERAVGVDKVAAEGGGGDQAEGGLAYAAHPDQQDGRVGVVQRRVRGRATAAGAGLRSRSERSG